MTTNAPHHGDGKGKPIEITHERTLREILVEHSGATLYPNTGHLDTMELEADLLALIHAREAMTRERCAAMLCSSCRNGIPRPHGCVADMFDCMPLPCEENAP